MTKVRITEIEFRGSPFSYKRFAEFLKNDCDDLVKRTCEERCYGGWLGDKYACGARWGKCTKDNIIREDNLLTIIKLYLNLSIESGKEFIKDMCELSFFSKCDYPFDKQHYCIMNV